jgi:hypothetical protein
VVAAGLLWWSLLALRQRRLMPKALPARAMAATGLALLAYWALRVGLSFHGFRSFPT